MKILLLNQTFHPDVVSTAQHLTDLATGLAARGHQVTVVTGRRAYDDTSRRFPKHELWRGIEIHRVGGTTLGKSAKWRRAVDFASFIITCCWRLLFV
ncbi:MAG TPA: glycosyltransferase, partial [Verrucomicrobiota bacterium]|nr:glycosyltransferase [Verrucomicrobiota bacterium]